MGDDLYSAEFEQAAADFMGVSDELMPNTARALRLAYGDGLPAGRAGDVAAVREFLMAASGR